MTSQVSVLKESHQPEEVREKRKKLYEIHKNYSAKNIETIIKGDKLVFTKSGNIYRDKLDQRPTADEVISGEKIKTTVSSGQRSAHRYHARINSV